MWALGMTPPEKREEWLRLLNDPLPGEKKVKPSEHPALASGDSGFMDLHHSRGA